MASRLLLRPQISSSNFKIWTGGGGGGDGGAAADAAAAAALLLLFSSCVLLNQFCHPSLIKYILSNSKTFEL